MRISSHPATRWGERNSGPVSLDKERLQIVKEIQGVWLNAHRPWEQYSVVGQTVTRRDFTNPTDHPHHRVPCHFNLHWDSRRKQMMWGTGGNLLLELSTPHGQRSEVSWISVRTGTREWCWQRPVPKTASSQSGGTPPTKPASAPRTTTAIQWAPAQLVPDLYATPEATTPVILGQASARPQPSAYGPIRRASGRESGRENIRERIQPYARPQVHRPYTVGNNPAHPREDQQRSTASRPLLWWNPSDPAERRHMPSSRYDDRLNGRYRGDRHGNYIPRVRHAGSNEQLRCGLRRTQVLDLMHREITPEDYEMLLRLDETVKKPTASKDAVEGLPVAPPEEYLGRDCTVCLVSFEAEDADVVQLPCRHCFHRDCITKWLSECNPKCPLCGESLAS